MRILHKTITLLIFAPFFISSSAFSAGIAKNNSDDSAQARVFFITIAIAVVAGFILYAFARRSAEIKARKVLSYQASSDGSFESSIISRLENISHSPRDASRVAAELDSMFQEKLEEKIVGVKQEMDNKYGKIIEQTELRAAEFQDKFKKTSLEKQQTEAVIRSVAEGLVVVNNKGEVLLMNPAAEKLLNVDQKEKIGKSVADNLEAGQLVSLTGLRSEDGEKEVEFKGGADETKKIIRSSSAVIEDENGMTVGMVSVLTDITKQRELDQLKNEFVSKVSHELRTPLVAMQQSIAVMLSRAAGPITEAQEKFLKISERNLKRLSSMIDDILDLSKLEANKMELRRELASINDIIDEACESLDTWANNKGIKIEHVAAVSIPPIMMDPHKITQVMNNLIGNAIKFTPDYGRITASASLSEDGASLEVRVSDTGVGIAKENLEKVFDRFQQGTERSMTDIAGSGLGLSISKEIVVLHGGKIWVENEQGQGTTFIFTLPATTQSGSPGRTPVPDNEQADRRL
ncbi:MAG: ATP-binding protein [Candidatus Omnitrophota bacterium]